MVSYSLPSDLLTQDQALTLGVTINNIVGVAVGGIGEQELWTDAYASEGIPLFPTPKELLPDGKVMFVMQIMHTCAMPVIKASVLAFYWRVFVTPAKSYQSFKIAIWVIAIYVLLWWIAIFFATLFQCNPISDNWGTNPLQLPGELVFPFNAFPFNRGSERGDLSNFADMSLDSRNIFKGGY